MAHTTVIIETKEVSDSQVSYKIRCCGDVLTDSWHTVFVTNTDIENTLSEHMDRVAAMHEAKIQWRKKNAVAVHG